MKVLAFIVFALMFLFLTSVSVEIPSNLRDHVYYAVSISYIGALLFLLVVKERIRVLFGIGFLIGIVNLLGAHAGWDWGLFIGILTLFTLVVGMVIHYGSEEQGK
ncbi:hypothetical protein [Domibacillus indicus]|uniref:hypothetical protein n=1 Tax=Domibacillus indicus TaxID=1437523 RepID=UPI0018CE97DD|nr:hypothetical protein [Domibacillus indicus]